MHFSDAVQAIRTIIFSARIPQWRSVYIMANYEYKSLLNTFCLVCEKPKAKLSQKTKESKGQMCFYDSDN